MKFKTYLIFNEKRAEIVWTDNAPVSFKEHQICKIVNVKWNKDTGEVEITMEIDKKNIEKVEKILKNKNV